MKFGICVTTVGSLGLVTDTYRPKSAFAVYRDLIGEARRPGRRGRDATTGPRR
ncbi:hypothetical protein ACQP2X_14210 [Actinoplanes sp. CA-131856]